MMKRILILGVFAVIAITVSGCASISHAPGVTQTNADGDYLTVVNKSTYFLYYPVSSRNVVVRCNVKEPRCQTLNLWTEEGFRVF